VPSSRVAKKRIARLGGQSRPREVPLTIREPASVAPLAVVPTPDDAAHTQKLKGKMHPRPTLEKVAAREAKMARREIGPRSSSNVGARGGEGSDAAPCAMEFIPRKRGQGLLTAGSMC